jgi:hypothetical protein
MKLKAYRIQKNVYYTEDEYTTSGTYTYSVTGGKYQIHLVGGGGGSAQTDGGTDSYSDTSWAWHYGKSGSNGGTFDGLAVLPKGTLEIVVGAVGTNVAGKGVASGNGGDSYAIFTPENGEPVEIARACGGKSGYPDGSNYQTAVEGGKVTYNPDYFEVVDIAQQGMSGILKWSVKR